MGENIRQYIYKCATGKDKMAKKWISCLMDTGYITDTRKQLRDNFLWKDNNMDGGLFPVFILQQRDINIWVLT